MSETSPMEEVENSLDGIVDPCSQAAGTPLSILDMGIVDTIDIDDGTISISLLPTSITCPFFHNMTEEITKKLYDYEWVTTVEVTMETTQSWSAERMEPTARERLASNRREMRETHDITPYAED